ncbi:RIMS-binding protein 3C, partial [Bienertia sinuspersici]
MVENALEEIGLDDDFINDGDIEYYGSTMVICIIVGILQIKMVGRGGGKNVGNRNKGGNGMRYGNVGERLPKTLNLVQDDCDDTLAQNFSRNGHTQPQVCTEFNCEFKKISERNSKNRLSEKRTKTTIGNLSFAEVEEILTQENQGVKPPADVIWLVEHTTRNNEGVLQWVDESRSKSKEIHEQLKVVVAIHGDSMTQEEILLDVLKPRSGYFRGKGTALREQRIKELQETQEKTTTQLQEAEERTSKQLEQQREDMQRSIEEMMQQLLSELIANRGRGGAVRVGAGVGRGCRGGCKAMGWQGASGGGKGLNGWGAGAIDGLFAAGTGRGYRGGWQG